MIFIVAAVFCVPAEADEIKVNEFKVLANLLEIEVRQAIHIAAQIGYIYGAKGIDYEILVERITATYGENPGHLPDIVKKYHGYAQ